MSRSLWLAGLGAGLLGLCLAAPVRAALPPPTGLVVTDDQEDSRGSTLKVAWKAPQTAPPAGMTLGGYVVYLTAGKRPTKRIELLVAPDKLETVAEDLKPWRHYAIGVSAVYVPAGVTLEPDPLVPTAAGTSRAEESPQVTAAPMAPTGTWFKPETKVILIFSLVYIAIVILTVIIARRRDMYIRPIAGLRAVDDAIGRATEMGRPILYVSGLSGIGDIATIAAMLVLGHLSRRTAAYETPVLVPCLDPLVMAIQREIVHEAHLEAGKPDAFNPDNIFFVTDSQFGYVAAVDGIMLRQKPAANFYMGFFYAESLILAETGSTTGAIQIAGTDADTQLPFFITSCDYTLMGEELYAAGAYLSRDPVLLAQLKGQDLGKVLISLLLLVGFVLVGFTTELGQKFLEMLKG